MKKLVDGVLVDLTAEEMAERQAEEAADNAARITAHLTKYAKQKRDGGIMVSGVFVATGESDRSLINGAVTRALLDNDDFKTYKFYPTGGGAVTLTNAHFKTIGAEIAKHVQKCLDIAETLDVSSMTTTAQVEAAFDAAYLSA